MDTRRRLLAVAGLLAGLLSPALPLHAESAPAIRKPVRIVVGFPPGGSADTLARALAQQLSGLAPAVLVDNKPGAGGRIALEALKGSEADGSTLALTPASMVTVYPNIYRKLSYDPIHDFAPIARVAAAPFVVAIGPQVPSDVNTLGAFSKWAKANPTLASYGSSGAGSIPHFTGVLLGKEAGMEWMHVAYKGAAPAMNDLLGGQIAANVSVLSNALPHIQAGKLRALAVSSSQRNPALPQVPTFAEAGYKNASAVEWFGLFAPAGTPATVIDRIREAVSSAVKTQGYLDSLTKGGFDPFGSDSPALFGAAIRTDIARWAQVVKTSGFTPED
jgi:tripartite-type tricarboxylate transporter receptor subunit TctC